MRINPYTRKKGMDLSVVSAVLHLFVTVGLLYFLMSRIDIKTLIDTIRDANLILLILATFLSLATNFIVSALIWQRILVWIGNDVSFWTILSIRVATYPIKIFLPLKTGEISKALYLSRKKVVRFAEAAGSILLMEVMYVQVLLSFTIFYSPIIVLVIGILFAPFFIYRLDRIDTLMQKGMGVLGRKFVDLYRRFGFAFNKLSVYRYALLLLFLTINLLLILLQYHIIFRAIGVAVPLPAFISLVPLVLLISHIPITITGIGVRESAMVYFLGAYSSAESLLSVGLLISTIDYMIPALFGMCFMRGLYKWYP